MTLAAPSAPLEYSPSLESDTEAQAWLDSHQRSFGLFLNGSFTAPRRDFTSRRPDKAADSPEAELAHLTQASEAEITAAIEAARTAQPGWSDLGGHQRARLLYALARLVQKHARLFAVLESLDSGRALYQTRDRDIPAVARVFYHAAGLAQLMETTLPDRQALGVCGAISPWATPLTSLARQTATALAMGNCLVVKPDAWTSLTGLLLAELTLEAGLPQGVFNLLTGDQSTGLLLAAQDGLDHLSFAGATETGRQIRERSAGKDIRLDLCLNGKNPIILCDDADLDSAIEGIVDSIWTDTGRGNQAGARLLIQASIATDALSRLQARMQTLRVGAPLD
ncbi:MAG: aldehyde dehydrogenase family protein, partial [Mangrovicoccus sp.]